MSGGADAGNGAAAAGAVTDAAEAEAGADAGAAAGVAAVSGGGGTYTYFGVPVLGDELDGPAPTVEAGGISGSRGWCPVTLREYRAIPVSVYVTLKLPWLYSDAQGTHKWSRERGTYARAHHK